MEKDVQCWRVAFLTGQIQRSLKRRGVKQCVSSRGWSRSCSEEERVGCTGGDEDGEGEKSALPQPQSRQADAVRSSLGESSSFTNMISSIYVFFAHQILRFDFFSINFSAQKFIV